MPRPRPAPAPPPPVVTVTTVDLASPDLSPEAKVARLNAALRLNAYMGPHVGSLSLPQAAFLLAPHEEVLYGGSAGGGKSEMLLMGALQFVDIPGFNALLLRRTFAELSKPGALMDRAHTWLQRTNARWDDEKHLWRFPSTATVSFGYVERDADVYQYDGPEYQYIGWDELTAFPSSFAYTYLFSRLRRLTASPIPLRVRAASNPGGPGHEWVKARFGIGHDPDGFPLPPPPAKRLFIPAKLSDNPGLDHAAYRAALSNLDEVTRAQKEDGNWDVAAVGDLFQPEMLRIIRQMPVLGVRMRCRGWDKAGTDAADRNAKRAKFTVGLRMSRVDPALYGVEYIIEDVIRGQWAADKRDRVIREAAGIYRPEEADYPRLVARPDPYDDPRTASTRILVEREPGSGGMQSAAITVGQLAGRSVEALLPSGDKETRWRPWASQVNAGNVGYVPGPNMDAMLSEMRAAPFSVTKDCLDSGGMTFNELALAPEPAYPASAPGQMRALPPGARFS